MFTDVKERVKAYLVERERIEREYFRVSCEEGVRCGEGEFKGDS